MVPWQTLQECHGGRPRAGASCSSTPATPGNAYSHKLGNAAYHANIITYASARFDQEALEDAKLGHGLFTYAVAEGLDGKGDLRPSARSPPRSLAEFVIKRVDELAQGREGRAGAAILPRP